MRIELIAEETIDEDELLKVCFIELGEESLPLFQNHSSLGASLSASVRLYIGVPLPISHARFITSYILALTSADLEREVVAETNSDWQVTYVFSEEHTAAICEQLDAMEDAHNALVDAVRVLDVLDYKAPMVALLQLAAQKYNLPAVEIVTGVRDTRISREQVYIKDEE